MTSVAHRDVEVFSVTPAQWRKDIRRMVKRTGFTFEQLRAQAEADDFASIEAEKAWLVLSGGLSRYADRH
jgi:hypothetical protein